MRKAALLWPRHIDRLAAWRRCRAGPSPAAHEHAGPQGACWHAGSEGEARGGSWGGGCSVQLGAGQEPSCRRMERNGLSKDCKHWVEFLQLRKPVEAAGLIDTVSRKEGVGLEGQPAVLILPCICVTLFICKGAWPQKGQTSRK